MATPKGFERWWLNAWPHRWHIRSHVPRFLRACPDPFRGEVIEVGSGLGWTSQRILETFPQVELTATDIDASARHSFDRLQQRYGQRLKFKQADVMELPFDRESFDIAIAIHALHYVDDPAQAIRQFLRVIRPGGLLGLSDENQQLIRPLRWLFPAASLINRKRLEEILREEECEIVTSQGELHYFIWARKPYRTQPTEENSS